jgi:tRNA U34 5-carboxymethylaminomethyl modifying enzyme MnmG/GidA
MDTETAQVDPFEYTTKVFENSGAELVIDSVSELIMSEQGECEGVLLKSGETLKADNTVVATGAWLA